VSALAHLAHLGRQPTPGERMIDATGLRPDEPPAPPEQPPAEPRRRASRTWWVLAAAFVLAIGVGAAIAFAQRPSHHAAADLTPAKTPSVPVYSVSVSAGKPSATTSEAVRINTKIKPTITRVQRSGGTFTITFTDPTKGLATFQVLLADDAKNLEPLRTPELGKSERAGVVTFTLSGLSPSRHCLVVLALAPGQDGRTDAGPSNRFCSN
jgi:hypothetical protein